MEKYAQGVQDLCDPCIKQKGSSRRSWAPSGGKRVCGSVPGGVTWDVIIEGIGFYHRLETRDWTDRKNTLSDVDPGVTRVENATEGIVGPGTDMSKCVTVGCTCYFHTKEGWIVEALHWLPSTKQGYDQESVSLVDNSRSFRSNERCDNVLQDWFTIKVSPVVDQGGWHP